MATLGDYLRIFISISLSQTLQSSMYVLSFTVNRFAYSRRPFRTRVCVMCA